MLRLTLFGGFALTQSDGAVISVKSRRARALLAYLALSPQMKRSREEIMALLWSDRAEPQARGSLRQVLTGLRKVLGANAAVLISDSESVALVPEQIALSQDQEGELLSGFHLNDAAFEDWLRDMRQAQVAASEAGPEVDTSLDTPDIAVLPFDAVPETPENHAFSDGMTEDIVTELSRFQEFVVYSPWSSFHYDADEKTTEEIGRDLEVDYVVEGSVRHASGQVRITAMLFDTETVNHVWVQRYDRSIEDVFTVQEQVARDVSTAVALQIEADACELAALRRPDQRTAMDHVLLGERAQQRDWNAYAAVAHYDAAIAKDHNNARAYANLANWHASSGLSQFVPFEEARRNTRNLAESALQNGADDALVLAILADAYAAVGDFVVSRQCLDKALDRNTNHHTVMGCAANTLAVLGDVNEAIMWLERYLRHDPLWQTTAMELAFEVYYVAGRFDDALAAIARLTDLPLHLLPLSAAAHAQCGQLDEAAALRQRYEDGLPPEQDFKTHIVDQMRICARQDLVDLWLDGLRKAGFSW